MDLENLFSIAQGLSLLFYPHVEVVIHDLTTETIVAIYNNLSKRKVGDESLLDDLSNDSELPKISSTYFKTNWDGRMMKSITIVIHDAQKQPSHLLCINLDLSKWEEMQRFLSDFLPPIQGDIKPEFLFKNDWREKINIFVTDYLKKEGLTLRTLTKEQKRSLIHALHEQGAFQAKNAAAYIGDVLEMSRATIYNYLK
jgi:D-arginine utilization repressor